MSFEPVIRVENLSKIYPIYDTPRDRLKQFMLPRLRRIFGRPVRNYCRNFQALNNVSFEVSKGETVGIIGRNGSGKSTLLQLICATLTPTSGQIQINGRIAALLELGSGFNPDFSGRENVFLNSSLFGLSHAETELRFDDIVSFADIGDFIDQPVKTYSSGMAVRLAFAVTINVNPDILIIDEALSVGDAAFQFKCLKRIEELQEKGVTLLFVSHDMSMVQSFCRKVVYLEAGQIKAIGNPEAVAAQYFFDNRELHRKALGLERPIFQMNPLGDHVQSAAFGTGEGKISKAIFSATETSTIQLSLGGTFDIDVEIEAPIDRDDLALAVVVQNHRLVEITGQRFLLSNSSASSRKFNICLENRFSCGDFFVTLRLLRHISRQHYMPIQSQIAVLHFQVQDDMKKQEFLGLYRGNILLQESTDEQLKVVAILAVRNEAQYLDRCLRHLFEQGIGAYVIDNDSTDGSRDIALRWQDRCVIGVENYPYNGFYDWQGLLRRKAELSQSLDADWFIHHDADEIRQSRNADETLQRAISRLDAQGYNAVDFDEFVFLPRDKNDEPCELGDYVERLMLGYYFAPSPRHRVNAWKKTTNVPDLVTEGGHRVQFPGLRLAQEKLILRHYPFVSAQHLYDKYKKERVYSDYEVNVLQWHGKRADYCPEISWWPALEQLIEPLKNGWDTTTPWREHPFLGGKPPR